MFILIIIAYFIYFWREVIADPYSIASGESIDADFGSFRLSGECWRKGKIPQDPYYYRYMSGVRPGTYYPINILLSYLSSFFSLDNAWKIYVFNLLVHNLFTTILAYYLFGQGWLGLFGALMWGFSSFHIKWTMWYCQLFIWITATLLCIKLHSIWTGVSLAMLFLSGHPPFVAYFCYFMVWFIPLLQTLLAFLIASPQIVAYYKYHKISLKQEEKLKDKLAVGRISWWTYLFMFLPIRYRDFIAQIGYEEWCFYLTPLGLFAIEARNPYLWGGFLISLLFSLGVGWKIFDKLLHRWTYRWGYFVSLFVIALAVDGLGNLHLADKQLMMLTILLAILLTFNKEQISHYPFRPLSKKPSEYFETPLMKWLEIHAKGYRVNNLPYPVYTGQINHILTVGYTGGNMIASLNKFLKSPKCGYAPYNWFDFLPDGEELDAYKIKYHIGSKPNNNPKWKEIVLLHIGENPLQVNQVNNLRLWENINI